MGNRAQIHVFQLAAHGHAARQARGLQAFGFKALGDHMGRGLALGGEVGSQNNLLHDAVARPRKQFLQAQVMGANAVQRTELAHEHKVQAPVGAGALQRRLVGRRLHHAELGVVTPGVQAGGANAVLGERVAALAVVDVFGRLYERARQCLGTRSVALQEVKRHPLRRLDPHARQPPQRLDQGVERMRVRHAQSKSRLASRP